jgi:hypothetical protein
MYSKNKDNFLLEGRDDQLLYMKYISAIYLSSFVPFKYSNRENIVGLALRCQAKGNENKNRQLLAVHAQEAPS